MAVRYIPTSATTYNVYGGVGQQIALITHDQSGNVQLSSVDDNDALRGVAFASALVINRMIFKLQSVGQGAGLWIIYGCNDYDQFPNHTLTQIGTVNIQTSYAGDNGGYAQNWVVADFANATPYKWYFIAKSGTSTPITTARVIAWEFWDKDAVPVDLGGSGDTTVDPGTAIDNSTLETQSYDNLGGSGLRAGPIPGSNSSDFDARYGSSIFELDHNYPAANGTHAMALMFDGIHATNGIYAWSPNASGAGGSVVDCWFKFSLRGQKRKITKASLYFGQLYGQSFGSHKWQGSNDDSNWYDLTDSIAVTIPASAPHQLEFVFDRNIDHYKHYRMIGVSGTGTTGSPVYIGEVEFEISGVPYEKGDRRDDINIGSNIVLGRASWPALFDDVFTAYSPDGAPTWGTSQSAVGKYITWSFPRPVLMASLFWQSGAGASIGVPSTSYIDLGLWDLYGSNNKYDWHALASNINRQVYGGLRVDLSANEEPYQYYKLVPQGPNLLHTTNNFDDNVMAEFLFDITAQYDPIDPNEPAIPVSQSYDHLGGVGQRSDGYDSISAADNPIGLPFDITTNATPYSSSYFVTKLFDGVDATNSSAFAYDWATQAATGKYIKIEWRGRPRVIDGFTWKQSTADAQGTWRFEGSDDGATWDNLSGDFALGGMTTQVVTFDNIYAYAMYRIAGVSGNTNGAPYLNELTLRTSGLPFERGDRREDVIATTTVPSHPSYPAASYPFNSIIDGVSTTNKWRPAAGQAVAGLEMRFEFPYKVRITKLYWLCGNGNLNAKAMGTWQPQGSGDGTNWTDLGSPITFTHAGASWFDIGDKTAGEPFKIFRLLGVSGTTEASGTYSTSSCRQIEFDIHPAEGSPFEVAFTDESELSVEGPVLSLNLQIRFYDEGQLTLDSDALEIEIGTGTFYAVTFADESRLNVTPTIVGGTSGGSPANVQLIVNRSN